MPSPEFARVHTFNGPRRAHPLTVPLPATLRDPAATRRRRRDRVEEGEDGWRGLLGEFQLAFVLLMALSSMEALEQWKRLTHVVCSCAETAVFEHPELYSNFIDALDAQLGRAGEDFFVDDYSEDNFLRPCLVSLMRVDVENDAPESDVVDVDAQRVLDSISGKLEKLAKDVKKKFDVDLVGRSSSSFQRVFTCPWKALISSTRVAKMASDRNQHWRLTKTPNACRGCFRDNRRRETQTSGNPTVN